MAGVVSGEWWVQVGDPGKRRNGPAASHMERAAEVTCYVSAVAINSILRNTHSYTKAQ